MSIHYKKTQRRWLERRVLILLLGIVCLVPENGLTQVQADYNLAPVYYSKARGNNTISRLQAAMDEQRRTLPGSTANQILKALLDELNIPVSSQCLVFSKTSKQRDLISPANPRALYFNRDFYIGYVPGGKIEVIACDDPSGMMYYTLDPSQPVKKRNFQRANDCLSCHSNTNTHNVPGLLVRSVYTDPAGQPQLTWGSFTTFPSSPLSERWGGWYVTGTHGDKEHMGNKWLKTGADGKLVFRKQDGQNVEDLSPYIDTSRYLTGGSDIVALMIMEHQIEAHHVMEAARLNFLRYEYLTKAMHDGEFDSKAENTSKMIESHVHAILSILMFANELPLHGDGVQGTNVFVTEFGKRGESYEGRSLRDLRLQKRLFKYRCSFMIHSESFKMLPEPIKTAVLHQLHAILTEGSTPEGLPKLSRREKERIDLILSHTLPAYQKLFVGR